MMGCRPLVAVLLLGATLPDGGMSAFWGVGSTGRVMNPSFWGVRGGSSNHTATASPDVHVSNRSGSSGTVGAADGKPEVSQGPAGEMVCEGDVCYLKPSAVGVPKVSGGHLEAEGAAGGEGGAYTDEPHQDYWSSQVELLAGKGFGRAQAEEALKAAKYDVAKAEEMLRQGGPVADPAPAPAAAAAAEPEVEPEEPVPEEHEAAPVEQPQAEEAQPAAAAAAVEEEEQGASGAEQQGGAKAGAAEEAPVPPEWAGAVETLKGRGLDVKSSLELLQMTNGNATSAIEMLEEDQLARDLDAAVEDMVKDGWDEEVARSALLSQREKMKEQGLEMRVSSRAAAPAPAPAKSAAAPAPAPTKQGQPPQPKPAKKEDVVFEAEETDLQKLVVESPVPVLLDVYADWCGPCKQLAPMLEDIAVRAGGMLRLVKVNSDKNRGVADALKVTALPSVFAFRGGRLVDKFVGIPPQGELQQLLMGLLMGAAPKADKDKDLGVLGNAFNHLAGLAALGMRRKEKLETRVQALLEEVLEGTEDAAAATTVLRTLDTYLLNVIKNPFNATFRSINTTRPAFQSRLAAHPSTVTVLKSVGFKDDDSGTALVLRHRNMAPIIAAEHVVARTLGKLRKGGSTLPIFRTKSYRRKGPEAPAAAAPSAEEEGPAPAAAKPKAPLPFKSLTLRLPDGSTVAAPLKATDTLQAVVDLVRARPGLKGAEAGALRLVSRVPEVRTFVEGGQDIGRSLKDLGIGGDAVLSVVVQAKETRAKKTATVADAKARKPAAPAKKRGVHTLYSEGHYDEAQTKGNRYFGGGSTYYEAAVDEEDQKEGEGPEGAAASKAVESAEKGEEEEEHDEEEEAEGDDGEEEEEEDEEDGDEEDDESSEGEEDESDGEDDSEEGEEDEEEDDDDDDDDEEDDE